MTSTRNGPPPVRYTSRSRRGSALTASIGAFGNGSGGNTGSRESVGAAAPNEASAVRARCTASATDDAGVDDATRGPALTSESANWLSRVLFSAITYPSRLMSGPPVLSQLTPASLTIAWSSAELTMPIERTDRRLSGDPRASTRSPAAGAVLLLLSKSGSTAHAPQWLMLIARTATSLSSSLTSGLAYTLVAESICTRTSSVPLTRCALVTTRPVESTRKPVPRPAPNTVNTPLLYLAKISRSTFSCLTGLAGVLGEAALSAGPALFAGCALSAVVGVGVPVVAAPVGVAVAAGAAPAAIVSMIAFRCVSSIGRMSFEKV